jgi:hypothetical protein
MKFAQIMTILTPEIIRDVETLVHGGHTEQLELFNKGLAKAREGLGEAVDILRKSRDFIGETRLGMLDIDTKLAAIQAAALLFDKGTAAEASRAD